MVNVTVAQVLIGAAQKLGDSAQQFITSTLALEHFPAAFREYVRMLSSLGEARARRETWILVQPGTSQVRIDTHGANYTNLIEIAERPAVSFATVSAVDLTTPGVPILTTTGAHGRVAGHVIQIGNLPGIFGLRGPVVISLVGTPTTLSVIVPGVSGTLSTTGDFSYGTERLHPVGVNYSVGGSYSLPQGERAVNRIERVYLDEYGSLRFTPVNSFRQLRILHFMDGDERYASSDLIGWDMAEDFLAYSVGLRCAEAQGVLEDMYDKIRTRLYGPGGSEGYHTGGVALTLKQEAAKQRQRQRIVRQPWRPVHTMLRFKPSIYF